MPSRGLAARHAVTSTTESPKRTMTEPCGLLGELAGFDLRVFWPMVISRVCISKTSD